MLRQSLTMKNTLIRLVVLAVICQLPTQLIAVQTGQKSAQDAQKSSSSQEETKKDKADVEITETFSRLNALVEEREFAQALKLMTEEASAEFLGTIFLTSIELTQFMDGDDTFRPIQTVNKKYGLDKLKLPDSYLDADAEFPSANEMKKVYKQILDHFESREKSVEAAREVSSSMSEVVINVNPFDAVIVEREMAGDEATLTVQPNLPEEMDEGEVEEFAGEPGEFEVPPAYLTFKKIDGTWKWSGYDDEKTAAAAEEFYNNFEMDELKPLPLIEDVQLNGKALSGNQIDLVDFRGKFVLIDFWGTWCGPCVAELPSMKKIHAALKPYGFEVIGVAADDEDSLKEFMQENGVLPWENVIDSDTKIAETFGVEAFPTTLLIDKEGKHVKSDLFGVELLDELIERMELDASDFSELRDSLQEKKRHTDQTESDDDGKEPSEGAKTGSNQEGLPVGFDAADQDDDGKVSASELKRYLDDRLRDSDLPHQKIFDRLNKDEDQFVSEEEFRNRHEAIMHFMGEGYFAGAMGSAPADPGPNFVPFTRLNEAVDDRATFGALYHRYFERYEESDLPQVDLKSVPASLDKHRTHLASPPSKSVSQKPANVLSEVVKASIIIAGGGEEFFTAGAVLISPDGLALTNYHVAEILEEESIMAMTSDGKTYRVEKFQAGNRERDVALIQLEGEEFPYVSIAGRAPCMGDDIVMVHHSENRFYTYDRGYVMRHPKIGNHTWMEISADYAPGGSGFGIFNEKFELVGLVSMIQFGDGPSLAQSMKEMHEQQEDFSDSNEGISNEDSWDDSEDSFGPSEAGILMVKHAVSLSAIHSLWKKE